MLHSWNKFASRFWPAPAGGLALSFVGDHVMVVRCERTAHDQQITHQITEPLGFLPFRSTPRAEDAKTMTEVFQEIAVAIPQGHWPLQIALPDPAGVFEVLVFDSLPASARDRAALARFRLEKDWPMITQMECVTQALGKASEKELLLVVAADRQWLELIRNACRRVNWVPRVMDMTVNHVFNRFYAHFAQSSHDGVLIIIEPDYWAVLLFDTTPNPRFFRTRWRDTVGLQNSDLAIIATEVERLVRAYVLAEPGRKIEQLYIYANESDRILFAASLDTRMRVPSQHLDASRGFVFAPGISPCSLTPSVLAAAVPR
ncbi:MAG: hypothetical protein HY080_01305 [Gammaproteobacteria bacterium]|nr:hypothetical protein [Gammaproteobacteria bacterium]